MTRYEESVSVQLDERSDGVVVVRMMHGRANALDVEFCAALVRCFAELTSGSVRAVVLTGNGSIFSAGVDLIRLCDGGSEYRDEFVPWISKLVHALFRFPKPLVAAVNGHAIAGGCIMTCTADRRVMARGTGRIGVPELLVGVPLPTAALEAVRFVVPPHRMQAVVYDGVTYTAEEALTIGLVDEVVEPAVLLDRAVTAAGQLAELPAEAFALTKRQLRTPAVANMEAAAAIDAEVMAVWQQAATVARVRDYIARTFKRPVR